MWSGQNQPPLVDRHAARDGRALRPAADAKAFSMKKRFRAEFVVCYGGASLGIRILLLSLRLIAISSNG
jgi:hypothetical protein